MRVAVLADIHANLGALEAVLADIAAVGVEETVVLGDIVGYGPDPAGCIERIMALPQVRAVLGNHEAGILDDAYFAVADNFNRQARAALEWTRSQLSPAHLAYLRGLRHRVHIAPGVIGVHGTLDAPASFDYHFHERADGNGLILTESLAGTFSAMTPFNAKACLCGHSHLPVVFFADGNPVRLNFGNLPSFSVSHYGERFVACVGAVGQPRGAATRADGRPIPDAYKACYVVMDEEMITFRRVDYDVETTAAKIFANPALPDDLVCRLLREE